MFYLKDLPTDRTLGEFAKRYPELDPSALKTCVILLRTGSDLLTAFETILGKHGLSQGRFLTLIVLNRTPNKAINPSTLAEKVGVKRATMTGLLDGLEGKELIERVAHPEDRRKLGIRLTKKGRQLLDKMLPDYYSRIAKLMVNLTENERQELELLLGKVNQGLSTLFKP
ncbi:MAG: MarR family transcriptional regulator [Deltaproteobacteria bacterium]|jgi:DNA-binding MarR family transcriptional regulator|nr:MarR family transcriptional regulator [Deltaproteobacteria bacterium]MBW1847640.1 MarR family transcriptional regulator [Deltaproteobacteria bacterium]